MKSINISIIITVKQYLKNSRSLILEDGNTYRTNPTYSISFAILPISVLNLTGLVKLGMLRIQHGLREWRWAII